MGAKVLPDGVLTHLVTNRPGLLWLRRRLRRGHRLEGRAGRSSS
jgi:hypothetical protein